MIVCGLDPSIVDRCFGHAVVEEYDGNLSLENYGRFRFKNAPEAMTDRTEQVIETVLAYLDEVNPDVIVGELPQDKIRNKRSRARGWNTRKYIFMCAALWRDVRFNYPDSIWVSASDWTVGYPGTSKDADKRGRRAMVDELFECGDVGKDVADAALLCHWYLTTSPGQAG